jgi:hypothetical protein
MDEENAFSCRSANNEEISPVARSILPTRRCLQSYSTFVTITTFRVRDDSDDIGKLLTVNKFTSRTHILFKTSLARKNVDKNTLPYRSQVLIYEFSPTCGGTISLGISNFVFVGMVAMVTISATFTSLSPLLIRMHHY